jgi:hypothetical protein
VSAKRSGGLLLWTKRASVGLVAGVGVGIGTALVGLRILGAGAPVPVAPVVVPEPVAPTPRRAMRGPRADGMRAGGGNPALVGGGRLASRDSVAVVPDLIGRAEGDARRLLERAGFEVGSVLFREDDQRMGTVLETFPERGERVQLPATVNLILADRRRYIDTLPYGTALDTGVVSVDSMRTEPEPDTTRMLPDTMPSLFQPDSAGGLPDTLPGTPPDTLPDTLPETCP